MNLIQLFLLLAIVLIAFLVSRSLPGDSALAIKRIFVILFALLAVLSIFIPSWLSAVANLLGVGRGADLLLYATVVAFLGSMVSSRKKRIISERRATELARSLALTTSRIDELEAKTQNSER